MELHTQSVILISLWLLLSFKSSFGTKQDIACLKSIKASFEDPLGYLNSSWNFNNDTEGFICRFSGVECWHPDENKVLNLRLSDMGLRGEFPRGIHDCSSMTGLDLSNNELYGKIPENINETLGFLTSLDLSSNNFSGSIPVNLARCIYLNTLKLDHNRLTGQIPPELGQLGRLKTFSVAYNFLSGQIPSFPGRSYPADNFANNQGLCGEPLGPCRRASKSTHPGVIAGAAIGGVTAAAIAVGIGMYFYIRRVSRKKKKDDDPDGNKWAKSLKGSKNIKAS